MSIVSRAELFSKLTTSTPWNVPVTILRQSAMPLDSTSIFKSLAEATAYAQTSASAHPGKIIAVIAEDGTTSYFGISQTGTLESIGGSVAGDNKTIVLEDGGQLSLKNFGKKYWQYTAGGYVETVGWIEGLEPKVRKISEGQFELAWYQPNPTTVEGLQAAIAALQSTTSNMYLKSDLYNKTEIDAKFDVCPDWGTMQ